MWCYTAATNLGLELQTKREVNKPPNFVDLAVAARYPLMFPITDALLPSNTGCSQRAVFWNYTAEVIWSVTS